jgi:hypothetical protein
MTLCTGKQETLLGGNQPSHICLRSPNQFGGKGDGDEIALNARLWATANDARAATSFHPRKIVPDLVHAFVLVFVSHYRSPRDHWLETNHPVASNADSSRKPRETGFPMQQLLSAPPGSIAHFGTVPIRDCMLLN